MKFSVLPAFALALVLAACATPEEKEAAHQRQLAEEARLNFLALKAREHPSAAPAEKVPLKPFVTAAPVKPVAAVKAAPAPKPIVQAKPAVPIKPFIATKPTPAPKPVVLAKPIAPVKSVAAAKPAPKARSVASAKSIAAAKSNPPAKPVPKPQSLARTGKIQQPGDTVYIWDAANARSNHYTAAELKYAQKMGKKPSQLTAAERQWVHDHS